MIKLIDREFFEKKSSRKIFLVDTTQEASDLPKDCAPGSFAIIADTHKIKILNNQKEWV